VIDIDINALVAPISEEAPGGPDLTYDADFLALETASQGKSEQQFGDKVIPAEDPDWRDMRLRAEALLARSKDLRVAVLLARALMRMHQVEGLATGLELLKELLSRYWDTLHPELDHEDNDDPMMRLNALGPLADPETFLRDIRNMNVVASPQHGRVTVRDVLVATGKLPPTGEGGLTESQISAILHAVAAENPAPLEAALASARSVVALEAVLSDKGVITQAPDLRPLNDMLQALTPLCTAVLDTGEGAAEEGSAGGGGEARARPPGQIATREDAIRVLENVCKFIEQTEPSNPAPLLIRRAQRLMSRSFVEIIQDLAPESLEQIQKLAGLESK
jgi:type VI secretion system protein ImpA